MKPVSILILLVGLAAAAPGPAVASLSRDEKIVAAIKERLGTHEAAPVEPVRNPLSRFPRGKQTSFGFLAD